MGLDYVHLNIILFNIPKNPVRGHDPSFADGEIKALGDIMTYPRSHS